MHLQADHNWASLLRPNCPVMNATIFDAPRTPLTMTWPAVGERLFGPRTGMNYIVATVLGEGPSSRVYEDLDV